ncbi:aminoacyl-tRNA hydrolase [Cytophagales bacterium WSM2-2]|nr:aminoacyl-tRNA hydrolase [Cytophagales bacterium WSM2-2]
MNRILTPEVLMSELEFSTSRSSGPGGQNVNKVNTKVTMRWSVSNSALLAPEEKELLLQKLSNRLTVDGTLILTAQEKRSQLQNKEEVLNKFGDLLQKAFAKKKKRKATKPSKGSVQTRLDKKKKHADKKKWRQSRF